MTTEVPVMSERIRLIIDTDDRLRRAVRMAAARLGFTPSQFVNKLLEQHLVEELADVDAAIALEAAKDAGKPPPAAPRRKKG
jgi:hypothetical protein